MLNPLKGLGDLNELRKQAGQMKAVLEAEEIAVEENGVRVVMRGDFKIKELKVDGREERRVVETLNKAMQKAQKSAASKLAGLQV